MQTEQTPGIDLLDIETELVRAETGKRFLNYIIDVAVFYALAIGVGVIVALISPESIDTIAARSRKGFDIVDQLVTIVCYALYMSIVETIFKGKSLGKLITGTRAVNLDGSRISTQTAFARGLSRAVPFCAFSALGTPCNPWQDKWTDTLVIDEKKSQIA